MQLKNLHPLYASSLCKAALMQGKNPHKYAEEQTRHMSPPKPTAARPEKKK